MTIANAVITFANTAGAGTAPISEPIWDIADLFPRSGQWSEDDFLDLKTNRLVELSNGSVEIVLMPTELHQDIVMYLLGLINAFIAKTVAGKVMIAPFHVRLKTGKFRDPDILFMKTENAHRRHNHFWDGADLVMEVVSDNDRRRDLETKRFEYARAGIPEYWIVDPMLAEITVLTLAGDRYEPAGVYKPGAQAASVLLPGFAVDVAATFAQQ